MEIQNNAVPEEIMDLNKLPFPDYRDFDLARYKQRGLPVLTSRGCVARCSFCGEVVFWKKYKSGIGWQSRIHRI